MKILAIDTSSVVATVAIMDEKKLISEVVVNHKRTHSQKLMPVISNTLEDSELTVNDIDAFAVSLGPGSFTGLRIGVATAKALAYSTNKPIIGVLTLDALASGIPFYEGIICPIMDARNNQVFTALYKWKENSVERITDYMGIEINELLEDIKGRNEKVVFLGDGVNNFKDIIRTNLDRNADFSPKSNSMQRASLVAEIAIKKYKNGELDDCMTISPFYLRKSQAEQLREKSKST